MKERPHVLPKTEVYLTRRLHEIYNYLQNAGIASEEELMRIFGISKDNLTLICHRINRRLSDTQIVRVRHSVRERDEFYIGDVTPTLVGTTKP